MPIDPHDAVAEDAVELDTDALAKIALRDVERAAIPADAVLGEIRADREASVLDVLALVLLHQRQFDAPVVREIHDSPG